MKDSLHQLATVINTSPPTVTASECVEQFLSHHPTSPDTMLFLRDTVIKYSVARDIWRKGATADAIIKYANAL